MNNAERNTTYEPEMTLVVTRRKTRKERLCGALLILMGVIVSAVEKDATALVLLSALGIPLMIGKKSIWQ